MKLYKTTTILFCISLIFTALIPPWKIQELNNANNKFGPPRSAGYSFVFQPPNEIEHNHVIKTATIDAERMFLQIIILSALMASVAILLKSRKSTDNNIINQYQTNTSTNYKEKPISHKWYKYQSLKNIDYKLNRSALLVIIGLVGIEFAIKYNRIEPLYRSIGSITGEALAAIIFYIVSAYASGYFTWKYLKKNARLDTIVSCLTPCLLSALIMFGHHINQQYKSPPRRNQTESLSFIKAQSPTLGRINKITINKADNTKSPNYVLHPTRPRHPIILVALEIQRRKLELPPHLKYTLNYYNTNGNIPENNPFLSIETKPNGLLAPSISSSNTTTEEAELPKVLVKLYAYEIVRFYRDIYADYDYMDEVTFAKYIAHLHPKYADHLTPITTSQESKK